MWSHLIKLVSLTKGALIVGVAASAAMVSNAEFSNTPSHNELPSATPSAVVSAVPTPKPAVESSAKPSEKPTTTTTDQPKVNESGTSDLSGAATECVTKYTALRAAGDSASQGDRESASAACKAAIEQSGLTSSEFAAKYGLTTTATAHPTAPMTTSGDLSPEALAMARECVTKYTLRSADASATCISAITLSGLTSSEFVAKFFPPRTTESTPTPAPKTTVSTELYGLISKCLQLYAAISTTGDTKSVSDACAAAIKASGLSSNDFWAKYHPTTRTEPTATPSVKPATAELEGLIYACRKLQGAIVSSSTTDQVNAASAACDKAIAASGLSAADFWAKWTPIKPITTPAPTSAPVTTTAPVTSPAELSQLVATCLDLYKAMTTTGDTHAVSVACRAAILASGMTSSDFWAKYHPATN
jgi:hypothetical protein